MRSRLFFLSILIGILIIAAIYYSVGQKSLGTLTLYGNVDIREVALGMRVGGKLSVVNFDEGDKIAEGQELAKLDEEPFLDSFKTAKAQADSLASMLDKLVSGPRPSEIDQAQASSNARKADLLNTEQILARMIKLRHDGTVSQAALDQAIASRNMSKAQLEAVDASLHLLLEGTRIEDIAVAKANLAGALATQASAKMALNDAKLIAPSDGTIRSRVREPGSILAIGEPVFVLSLDKPLRVRGYIGERSLGRIHTGQTVYVSSDSYTKKTYEGKIGYISSTAEFTPKTVETPKLRGNLVYRFWITLSPEEIGLQQGMPVTISIPVE